MNKTSGKAKVVCVSLCVCVQVCGWPDAAKEWETNGKAALAILIYVGRQRFAKLLNAASGIRTTRKQQEMPGKCREMLAKY